MRWFTADLHFGHKNILEYQPNRLYPTPESMEAGIMEEWNRVVKPEDEVWVLGDLSLGRSSDIKQLIPKLNGHKYLIRGNHDHHNPTWFVNAGFENVHSRAYVMIGRRIVTLSHYPFKPGLLTRLKYLLYDKKMLRFMDRLVVDDDKTILLHGHSHGKHYRVKGRAMDVGWDCWGTLMSEDAVARRIEFDMEVK